MLKEFKKIHTLWPFKRYIPELQSCCKYWYLRLLSRLKMLRTWGGIMDMSMDGSPIIDKTHIEGLYLNCGWCYGGFKSTPVSGWTFAHTIAQDQVHELNSELRLNRFSTGHLLDEKGLGTKTWIG